MYRRFAFLCVLCFSLATGFGAIVYEPVQSQYQFQYSTGSGPVFYYGGSDPLVFQHAFDVGCRDGKSTRGRQHAVYTDCFPYENAAIYGFGPGDARNRAYANVPRYFRKSELIAAAQVEPDGSLVIPAQAQPLPRIEIRPWNAATRPVREHIMIIPKPRPDLMPKNVVAATK